MRPSGLAPWVGVASGPLCTHCVGTALNRRAASSVGYDQRPIDALSELEVATAQQFWASAIVHQRPIPNGHMKLPLVKRNDNDVTNMCFASLYLAAQASAASQLTLRTCLLRANSNIPLTTKAPRIISIVARE